MAYFCEKLSGARKNCSTYDLEFYAIIQTFKNCQNYLLHLEFVLYIDHHALTCITNQQKVNARHMRWATYLEDFMFVLKHKSGF